MALDEVSSHRSGLSNTWRHRPDGACSGRRPSICFLKIASNCGRSGSFSGMADIVSTRVTVTQPLPRAHLKGAWDMVSMK